MPNNMRKILRELKRGLQKIYGDRLSAVILYGSFARGEGRLPDSDIDVMIVLKGEFNHREEDNRSADLIASLCLENEVLISWMFVSETDYAQSGMPLMINVRKEGVAI